MWQIRRRYHRKWFIPVHCPITKATSLGVRMKHGLVLLALSATFSYMNVAPPSYEVATARAFSPAVCPAGSYTNSSAGGACTPAPPGSYASGTESVPTPCPIGTFAANPGQSSCTFAAPGSYVGASNAISAIQCVAGNYQPASGQPSCIAASIGFYVSMPSATSQVRCVVGMTTNEPGSTACVAIPPLVGYDALISASQATPGVAASEVKKLVNARKSLVDGMNATACTAVDSFMSYVGRQSVTRISAANASVLSNKSQEAKIAIGC